MTGTDRTHLDQLENQSIFIFREAYHSFKNIAMPWSMGKDSNVLIWLALKSFFGKIPFPILHIDTTYEFPEMLEFREWATKHYKLNLIVKINEEARARGVGYETHDPVTVTHELKTVALQQAMAEHKWDALITGIRRDEDPTRAKERYFSPRNAQFEWDYKDQPPEFWGQFATTDGERRARARATAARLDRSRHLALHPAREHSHSENVFRARWKTFSLVRLQSDHEADGKQCEHDRRNHRGAEETRTTRASRPRAGPSRAQRDAETTGERVHVMRNRRKRNAQGLFSLATSIMGSRR